MPKSRNFLVRMDRLRAAAPELRYLLTRGYPRKSSVEFIGNHYQLTRDERNILFRGVFPRAIAQAIKANRVTPGAICGKELFVDGYNVTITLENAMKGHPIIRGNNGFIRDISGTFRGFRQSDLTEACWREILRLLTQYRPGLTTVLLDKPYSKSAQLARSIKIWMEEYSIQGQVLLSQRVDFKLKNARGVRATSDSTILIRGGPSLDLAGHIAIRRLKKRPFVVP